MIRTTNRLKASALTRRLHELKQQGHRLTEPRLGRAMQKSRSAVALWKVGRAWPSPIEEARLEELLGLPGGFFAHVGRGVDYESARQSNSHTASDPVTIAIDQYRQLLELAPGSETTQAQLERVRLHLQEQIASYLSMMLAHGMQIESSALASTEEIRP